MSIKNEKIEQVTIKNLSARYNKKQKFISNDISFTIEAGEVMAIMGPSGSGKSTLLKAILGTIPLEKNKDIIYINGNDATQYGLSIINHKVGYVPQDDVLIEELTIKENIRSFHTIAIDSDYSNIELDIKIDNILNELNLNVKEQLGNKKINQISGGQRKRVNIALELINEPDILIIDEPTSGLSSLDSLDLLQYLKNYAKSGKIVIIIIHQPSADIYSIFDNLLLLNNKGECVFSGRKEALNSASKRNYYDYNTYPDKVMLSIEEDNIEKSTNEKLLETSINIPKKKIIRPISEILKDFWTLIKRNFLIKTRDKMSQLITFAVPPLLAVLISIVFKFSNEGQEYLFTQNSLYGQFLFMMIISGMFLGLVGSVTEIIRDRKMLEREVLRGLSTTNYFFSKLIVSLIFGSIQGLLFVMVSMYMLEAKDYIYPNLIVILLTMFVSISIGLLISMLVKTSVAAYNLIPLLLIPQIILGGAFLPFSNMGKEIYLWEDRGAQIPLLAKVIPATWIYEAAMSLNYEFSEQNNLDKNINLKQLKTNKNTDFLSLEKDEIFPYLYSSILPDSNKNKTFIYDINIIILFILFFILSAWIWIGSQYGRNTLFRIFLQSIVFTICFVFPADLIKPLEKPIISNVKEKDLIINKDLIYWFEANEFCKNKNMTLASVEDLINIVNTKDIPKSIYWTNDKYFNSNSTYWTVNFSKFTPKDYPIDINKAQNTKNVMIAYKQNTTRAAVLCVKQK